MSEEHAKVNRLDLLKLALIGANQRMAEAAHQIIDIQREIDGHNHPMLLPYRGGARKNRHRSIVTEPEVAHKPAGRSKRKALSAEARAKISAAQKKRWAAARKAAAKKEAA